MAARGGVTTAAAAAARPVWKLKQTYYHKLWHALTARRWHEFDRLLREMRLRKLNPDEVTYTLKAHQCILNPHRANMDCYLVLEEMKQALVHPAVIRMNEHLINSYFELEEIKCQPPAQLWQNFAKLAWQSSFRLNRRRMADMRDALLKMDPDDVMRLSEEDVATMAEEEFMRAAFSSTLAVDEIHDEPMQLGVCADVEAELSQETQQAAELAELVRAAEAAALDAGDADNMQDEVDGMFHYGEEMVDKDEDSKAYLDDYEALKEDGQIELQYVYRRSKSLKQASERSTKASDDLS